MKNLMGIIAVLLISVQTNAMTLMEAIEQKNVHVKIKKLDNQFNYVFPGKNIVISVLNKSGRPLNLDIKTGDLLESKAISTSNFVVIDDVNQIVEHDIVVEIGIYGMSLQRLLRQPTKNNYFTCKKKVSPELIKLCEYIQANNYFNSIGQDALWAINRDQPVHSIDGPNEITLPLKHYVADLLNLNYYPEPKDDNLIYITNSSSRKRLSFEFEIHKNDEIKMEVSGANGDLEEIIVDRKYQHRFNHIIYYDFPVADLSGKKIFIRSYLNNELLKEYVIVVEQNANSWMAGR